MWVLQAKRHAENVLVGILDTFVGICVLTKQKLKTHVEKGQRKANSRERKVLISPLAFSAQYIV